MNEQFRRRGFLPVADPLTGFPSGSPCVVLDQLGEELPKRLEDPQFRRWAASLRIPTWEGTGRRGDVRVMHLYYLRIGFLASAYVNQVGQPPARRLPANLAAPLCAIARALERPPILSYAGYALYNWYRLDPAGPVALGNIDTLQNFVPLYDEHWFILVHVDIEARAAGILDAMLELAARRGWRNRSLVDAAIDHITAAMAGQVAVLRRIPEHMSPELYYRAFRPYIRFFEHVVYEGVDQAPLSFRGETGAQSSVMPLLIAFFKIPHEPSELTRHLADMRRYMPVSHRALLERADRWPDVRAVASPEVFNRALGTIATFRDVHFGLTRRYVAAHEPDPRGTGGTPYLRWLAQLHGETLAHRVPT